MTRGHDGYDFLSAESLAKQREAQGSTVPAREVSTPDPRAALRAKILGDMWVTEPAALRMLDRAAEVAGEEIERLQPKPRERDELWSILDWTLWGNGMNDVFREPIADKMIAALTDEEHTQAVAIIAAWQERRGPHAMHPAREEIERLRAENTAMRAELNRIAGLDDAEPHQPVGEDVIEQAARTIYEGFFATQPLRYVPWDQADESIKDNNRLRACALADTGLLTARRTQDQDGPALAVLHRLGYDLCDSCDGRGGSGGGACGDCTGTGAKEIQEDPLATPSELPVDVSPVPTAEEADRG